MKSITESPSHYNDLEKQDTATLLNSINTEDKTVAHSVEKVIPTLTRLVDEIVPRMKSGGRIFYIGAGTSGRLGILDASECPPTYGVPDDWVIGLIAGGDSAIRKAVEKAEDDPEHAWEDLSAFGINGKDTLIGIAASGRTPYVIGGLKKAQEMGILTAAITCNPGAKVSAVADYPLEAVVGPEFVTGSTRMKAGTAQKLILNMITTTVMIRLGRVKGNKMVDMQLSNEKLVERGTRMLVEELGLDEETAKRQLLLHGGVRQAIDAQSS